MQTASNSPRLTRRALLLGGGGVAATIALSASDRIAAHPLGALVDAVSAPEVPGFVSRPDLRIPALTVNTIEPHVAQGVILVAPYNAPGNAQAGAIIVDDRGA